MPGVTHAERDDEARSRFACPACQSPPGRNCTRPTRNGRTGVGWVHHARTDLLDMPSTERTTP